jgi:hypothetical protein
MLGFRGARATSRRRSATASTSSARRCARCATPWGSPTSSS